MRRRSERVLSHHFHRHHRDDELRMLDSHRLQLINSIDGALRVARPPLPKVTASAWRCNRPSDGAGGRLRLDAGLDQLSVGIHWPATVAPASTKASVANVHAVVTRRAGSVAFRPLRRRSFFQVTMIREDYEWPQHQAR